MEFAEWLEKELQKRGMSQADLSRKSGISTSQISKILSTQSPAGPEACRSIAYALNLPEEFVFRKAGLLSEKDEEEWPPSLAELVHHYLTSNEEQQEEMLEIIRLLSKRSREETNPSET